MRQSATTLAITMVLAAILRFWALGSGIPFNVGVDEPEILNRAVQMMKSGDFNPRFFDYPGFYIHLQAGVACVRFLAGASAGRWHSLDQVDAADFYLWARALTALMGTLTVLLVYFIGMRWAPVTPRLAG
jgi:dolichyl-phosphate-mannose--protein O-mannosyl transferase